MDNLGKAYIASAIFTIAAPILGGAIDPMAGGIAMLVHVLVVGRFISKDTDLKGLSKNHQLWAWLGIIGVLIYHLGFVKKASQPQQPAQQPPMQQQPEQAVQQPPEQQQYQQPPGQYPQQPQQPQQ